MKNTTTFTKLQSLTMAEDSNRSVVIAIDRCSGMTTCHLYQVTLTRKDPGKYPLISTAFVIAPDEAEAIAQTEGNAFPEVNCYLEAEHRALLTATAVRVPVQVRGWGRQAF